MDLEVGYLPAEGLGLESPLTDEIVAAIITANVATLIPPAMDPAAPPTNIKKGKKSLVSSVEAPMSTVASPAVRPLTEWNTDWASFWRTEKGPSVPGLSYSAIKNTSAPRIHRRTLTESTILVSRVNRENRLCRNTSTSTVQLIPPRIIREATKPRSMESAI